MGRRNQYPASELERLIYSSFSRSQAIKMHEKLVAILTEKEPVVAKPKGTKNGQAKP